MMSETPRLYLITPPVADAAAFLPRLDAALDAADVACLLLRVAAADEGTAKAIVRAAAPAVQGRGVALLVEGDPRFCARIDADGLHVGNGPGADFEAARDALQPKKIVGVGGLVDRDAAMVAGEGGADYLMFGGPDERAAGSVPERVAWWAEIFNVPCVGYARDRDEARAIARAGAEFVALCEGVWDDPAAMLPGFAADLADVATSEPVP